MEQKRNTQTGQTNFGPFGTRQNSFQILWPFLCTWAQIVFTARSYKKTTSMYLSHVWKNLPTIAVTRKATFTRKCSSAPPLFYRMTRTQLLVDICIYCPLKELDMTLLPGKQHIEKHTVHTLIRKLKKLFLGENVKYV